MKNVVGYTLGALAAGLCVYLLWPSNYYLRKALAYRYPQIDDHTIFNNRIVRAGNPAPWSFSPLYGTAKLPESFREPFKRYETTAYLIVRDGQIFFEEYWDGYDETTLSNSFSMAKSIVSLLAGCAWDDKLIGSFSQPVSDYLPYFKNYGKNLTLHDLLTMSAAFEWDENEQGIFSPITRSYYGDDLTKIVDRLKPGGEPGKTFDYQSIATQVIALVIETVTGKPISTYASEKIWTPIRAEQDALWSLDRKNGTEKAFCCYNSTARDFARLGQLILNRGRWEGKQLVSEAYLEKALQPDTTLRSAYGPGPNHCYGYQFWILEYEGMTIPYLRGIRGQYVFALPELNAVVVRLGRERDKIYTREQHYPEDINTWLGAATAILRSHDSGSSAGNAQQ